MSVESLAGARGKNWGLPGAARSAVPITRPVLIQCRAQGLTILDDDGSAARGRVIALGERTEKSVDELVSAIWDRIDSWGIAGNGMYWRPVLAFEVAPGGAQRFADLQVLLQDSGLEVRDRSAGGPTAARYPSTTRSR